MNTLIRLLFACLLASAVSAQPLELTQIYGPAAVAPDPRPSIRWLDRGAAYTVYEKSGLVRYDTASGKRTVLLGAAALTPDGANQPLVLSDHQWSRDAARLLLSASSPASTWVYDLDARTLRRIGSAQTSGLLHPEFSPDGTRVAYVAGNNLFVENADGTAAVQLTTDGSELILNGRGDVAYEEEFGLAKAYAWSPDSRHLAYWRFDTNGVGIFTLVRNTGGQYSQTIALRYPKPGTTNSAVRVGVVSTSGPGTTWFGLEGDPRNHYVPRMDWAPNSREVLLQYENRAQNTNQVLLGGAGTGSLKPLFVEKDAAWLLPSDDIHWLDRGRAFTWFSERDGWTHLYVVSSDGQRTELRTPVNFDITRVVSIDAEAGYAWFIASPANVTQRYLYRARLRGKIELVRLTPAGEPGWHDYDLAPGAKWALHSFSTADSPPVTDLVRLPGHGTQRVLADNKALRELLANTPKAATEFFRVDIGATQLDAWMMKPPDFDPAKKYPLLVYVYSEPAGQTVADRWGGDRTLWHLLLTQRGYLVASIDSRGAAAPRGHDWRRSIYRQIGILASADQAAAVRRLLNDRPYIDAKRIGVWGWSGGGAMTLNAMFRYPDLYSTGIAVASPTDQMLYNSIYQERYMGMPAENPVGYRDGSPINFAQNLAGNLLIIHGTGDDNVHYQNAEQLVDRLISLDKPFSMMAYPDRTHGIFEGANTRLHLFSLATRFLEEHLPPTGHPIR